MSSTFITYYIETNLICLLFINFIFYSYIRESHGRSESKWFVSSLISVQLYCISDIFSALFKNQTMSGARTILWLSNTVYITLPLVLIVFWNLYISEHTRSYYQPGKLIRAMDTVILALSIIICVISLSTPLTHSTFYLDDLNGYHRTFGAYLVPAFAYLFMIYETVKLQYIGRRSASLQVKHDTNILSVFAFPCIFFSLIQVLIYGITIAQVGFTMALCIVFLGRQRNKISRDELTGLNNRREYEYAIDRLSRTKGNILILMADVNDFKTINDTYGHLEGDQALRSVAMMLQRVCSQKKDWGSIALYRYGGDEFSMISTDNNIEELKNQLLDAIQTETERWNKQSAKPYSLSISVGVASGPYSGKDIYKLIYSADQEMYAIKSKRKQK